MHIREIMTNDAAVCTADTNLRDVAQMMVEHDCGAIPVVDRDTNRLLGIVTDRDIACRTVARGLNPLDLSASDCMSTPCFSVHLEDDLQECCQLLEDRQVRRAPVVDQDGHFCGIIAQADIARTGQEHEIAEVVCAISR